MEAGEAPRERATGFEKLPAWGGPGRPAQPAKYLQRDSCGRTKPFSSAPRPKIWAPRGDRAPAAPLPGTQSRSCRPGSGVARGGGRGPAALGPATRPSEDRRAAAPPEAPPAAGARPRGTKGAEDSPLQQSWAALAAGERGPPTGSHGSEPSRGSKGLCGRGTRSLPERKQSVWSPACTVHLGDPPTWTSHVSVVSGCRGRTTSWTAPLTTFSTSPWSHRTPGLILPLFTDFKVTDGLTDEKRIYEDRKQIEAAKRGVEGGWEPTA
ncbi:cuticle collagen 2-like [Suricata suricatta]|uniref:cuticle collagen 2-like n=1 Tax=Suricata suricatta TaxID=37032 RepID=UPI0011558A36|nr:cuticle collagen 2-like [Suricata suricatta]